MFIAPSLNSKHVVSAMTTYQVDVNALFSRLALLVTTSLDTSGDTGDDGTGNDGTGDDGTGGDGTGDDGTGGDGTGDEGTGGDGDTLQPIDLSGATILEQSTPVGNRGGDAMLDNYLDPYNWDRVWMTEDVVSPFVTIDAGVGITISSVIFYKRNNDTENDTGNGKRFPENFEVLSGSTGTGPWTSMGTAVYSPYPAPFNTDMQVTVIFPSATTARYWRVIVSGHQWLNDDGNTISEIHQAVFWP